ncbi:hypothetical protein SAMN05216338_10382 [Bradyrhizobium sp. Rc2d]|nr:hypothetical protein SAMN05216338_10382 [Bradyrhizobium sp. Rc2d]
MLEWPKEDNLRTGRRRNWRMPYQFEARTTRIERTKTKRGRESFYRKVDVSQIETQLLQLRATTN